MSTELFAIEEPRTEEPVRTTGIVPPPGPLPRRFGPPWYVFWFNRVMALGVVIYGIQSTLNLPLRRLGSPWMLAVVLGLFLLCVVLVLRLWHQRRREITALAVTFEPFGITVSTQYGRRYLAWGHLVGLEPPASSRKGWTLRADVDGRPLLVRIPTRQDWARRLVNSLRGLPEETEDP